MEQQLRADIAEAKAAWKSAEEELSLLDANDPLHPVVMGKVQRTFDLLLMREAKETEYIKTLRPAQAVDSTGSGSKRIAALKRSSDAVSASTSGSASSSTSKKARLGQRLFRQRLINRDSTCVLSKDSIECCDAAHFASVDYFSDFKYQTFALTIKFLMDKGAKILFTEPIETSAVVMGKQLRV
ncbi:hypothetical protein HDU98_009009 [Podochytrium sp. JEL0797]|nr:hypothetical protein HDU98_009009 [Podochytrium sp. JEL0797]